MRQETGGTAQICVPSRKMRGIFHKSWGLEAVNQGETWLFTKFKASDGFLHTGASMWLISSWIARAYLPRAGMKLPVEIRAVMSEERPTRKQVSSAQTLISCLGSSRFRPLLSCYKRS